MRTPKEYSDLLARKMISEDMLAACLYSVNKRAKNYRDNVREKGGRMSLYTLDDIIARDIYYEIKEFLLQFISPVCIHRVLFGYERERIYEYDERYMEFLKADAYVWENSFWSDEAGCFISFGDIEWADRPKYGYFLYYRIGSNSFHSPVNENELSGYPLLECVDIGELETEGRAVECLVSMQFVDKVIALILSRDFSFTFTENVRENALADMKIPDSVLGRNEMRKQRQLKEKKPEVPSARVHASEEQIAELLFDKMNRKNGPPKDAVIAYAVEKGMEAGGKARRIDAVEYLKANGLLEEACIHFRVSVTKYDYNNFGMDEDEYRRLIRKDTLIVVGFYTSGGLYNQKINLYDIGQFLGWCRGAELAG